MEIHPEFDPKTKTWFWEQYEASTIRELRQEVGFRTTVKDYYPNGYDGTVSMTVKRGQDPAPTFAYESSELRITSTPKQPPKPAPVVDVADEFKIDSPGKARDYNLRAPWVPGKGWVPAELEKLQHLVSRGYSASQIAKSLGRTRNSIVGKANRMGLRIGLVHHADKFAN